MQQQGRRHAARRSNHSSSSEARRTSRPHWKFMHQKSWVPAHERTSCYICVKSFGIFMSKHHCRKCGEIVCHSCVVKVPYILESIGSHQVRMCIKCIEQTCESWDLALEKAGFAPPCDSPKVRHLDDHEDSHDKADRPSRPSTTTDFAIGQPLHYRDLKRIDDWVPSSSRRQCVMCLTDFGVFRHRYRCRLCGDIYCKDCSMLRKAQLWKDGYANVRVCLPCGLPNAFDIGHA